MTTTPRILSASIYFPPLGTALSCYKQYNLVVQCMLHSCAQSTSLFTQTYVTYLTLLCRHQHTLTAFQNIITIRYTYRLLLSIHKYFDNFNHISWNISQLRWFKFYQILIMMILVRNAQSVQGNETFYLLHGVLKNLTSDWLLYTRNLIGQFRISVVCHGSFPKWKYRFLGCQGNKKKV